MTRDEAILLSEQVLGEMVLGNPGRAATVIQQAFAERDGAIRQAGVQQGLDMAAGYLDGFKYNDIVMDGCTMRREWRKDFAAAIRKLGATL